ncbi:hypothetical protein [Pseudoroseicyclus aestuarii]|nr:hypothetical protein [Pseudoroseicyclus aestuarii]
MKAVFRVFLLAQFMGLSPLVAYADETDRIAEILHRQVFDFDGQSLVSEVNGSVEGCKIRLDLERPRACEAGDSYSSTTKYIDVRVLDAVREAAEIRDLSGTPHEILRGSVTYPYRSWYNRVLRFANEQSSQIRDEEYQNFPTDVDSRLRVLSRRYNEEIDPDSFSQSFEVTRYCSGVQIRSPLSSYRFSFYMDPSDSAEFVALLEDISQSCIDEVGS